MKTIYFLMTMLLLSSINVNAQFVDDMESYIEGEAIYENWWISLFCDDLGCALESTSAQAHSGNLSGLVPGDSTTDAILDLGNKIVGTWGVEYWAYIPSNKEAFWGVNGCVPICTDGDWLLFTLFNQNLNTPGEGVVYNSSLGEVSFNFPHDQWFKTIINVDLTSGMSQATWQYIIDRQEVIPSGTPFADDMGVFPVSFGGLEFFSISTNSELYVDDFIYKDEFIEVLPGTFEDDMEYPDGPPYGPWWTCWLDETNCDPFVIGPGAGHEGEYSGYIPDDGLTEEALDLGNQISGEWGLEFYMYVPSGKEAFWNLQGEVPIGAGEWIVGFIYLNQDLASPGQGVITDTALGEIVFDFPHDEWFRVAMNFDLSLGIDAATWGMSVNNILAVPEGTTFTNLNGDIPTSLGGVSFYSISSDNEYYIDTFNFINDFLELAPIAGIDDTISFKFSVYPNPSNGVLYIQSDVDIEQVNIYSIQGILITNVSEINDIDVSHLSTGIYFIEVLSEKGKSLKKFIKI